MISALIRHWRIWVRAIKHMSSLMSSAQNTSDQDFSLLWHFNNRTTNAHTHHITRYLRLGADWPSTLCASVGAELVKASHANWFLVFPHELLSTEVLATVKTAGTVCHSPPINPAVRNNNSDYLIVIIKFGHKNTSWWINVEKKKRKKVEHVPHPLM